jgi:aminopeptidase
MPLPTHTPPAFDVETLALKTVEQLNVTPGQVIWIWASTHSLDLVEALAYHLRARGAFWLLRLTMEGLLKRLGQHAPEQYLALVPEHELRWLADAHAIIEVRDHGGHVPDVPLPRRRALGSEWIALIEEASRRGLRRLMVVNPTPALAAAYQMPLERLRSLLSGALAVDYPALDRQQEKWAARLAQAGQVHITCPLGTDLALNVAGRPVHQDTDSLPHGEVYVAPLEDSAEGAAVIEQAFLRGRPVERLRLEFRQGRLANYNAPDPAGAQALQEVLQASSGDKDVIAELGIGLNPGLHEVCGNVSLDEKIGGSLHIAIGMNDLFAPQSLEPAPDLVILRPTLWLDGQMVIQNGILLDW